MDWVEQVLPFLWEILWDAIKSKLGSVIVGIFLVQGIEKLYDYIRYGRWKVILYREGRVILDREISTGKAKEIIKEEAELSVFLKGVISPYAHLTCDILMKGREIGLLKEDKKERLFIVDLDKNLPKEDGANASSVL